MVIQHFFDQATSTLTYVVHDGGIGIVIDPVLDYDPKSARTTVRSAEAVARYIDHRHLSIPYVIDTHAHADHLTAMPFFKKRYGSQTVTGSRVGEVQRSFRDIYNLGAVFPSDGRLFDIRRHRTQHIEKLRYIGAAGSHERPGVCEQHQTFFRLQRGVGVGQPVESARAVRRAVVTFGSGIRDHPSRAGG